MWTRAELKQNAKLILKRNYWWAVLITVIFMFTCGGGAMSTGRMNNSGNSSFGSQFQSGNYSYGAYDDFGDEYSIDEFSGEMQRALREYSRYIPIGIPIFAGVITFALAVGVILSIFVFAPLEVGIRKWYIQNRTENPQINVLATPFTNGYMNVVAVLFKRSIFTMLWSLLFIIPGIIKAYEYRMIPYLLAENPQMTSEEAFRRSKIMMSGNKLNAFVLDLSFIGWSILSAFTCGILGVLFVNPYEQLTNTELYVALCQTGYSNTNMGSNTYTGSNFY